MVDGLLNLGPVKEAIGAFFSEFGGYLVVPLGVYLALFVIGLVIESVQSRKAEGR